MMKFVEWALEVAGSSGAVRQAGMRNIGDDGSAVRLQRGGAAQEAAPRAAARLMVREMSIKPLSA